MLGEQGYEVRPVTNGRTALLAAERDPPDLILLDINMPEMNGYEVCAQLKARPGLKDIPVVFLTALGDVADKVKAFDAGGVDYITKPFQIEEVQARVKTHLALRRAARELAASYERQAALEKLRDDLVHMVVHDMRSPLTVLVGHLELLRHGALAGDNDDASDDLRAAERAARTLSRMANDLLDVSRLEQNKLPLRLAASQLSEIAVSVVDGFRQLERKRVIEVELSGQAPTTCDADLVRRVLENLVGNALKHTPVGAEIRVAVAVGSEHTRVEVVDAGPGVPAEARSRIFEKFETLDAPGARRHHSAGLGLAFCKLAVEAHGGRIGVDAGASRGSVFWFELPRPSSAR
jgi:signal transduction histidine kinase